MPTLERNVLVINKNYLNLTSKFKDLICTYNRVRESFKGNKYITTQEIVKGIIYSRLNFIIY